METVINTLLIIYIIGALLSFIINGYFIFSYEKKNNAFVMSIILISMTLSSWGFFLLLLLPVKRKNFLKKTNHEQRN